MEDGSLESIAASQNIDNSAEILQLEEMEMVQNTEYL